MARSSRAKFQAAMKALEDAGVPKREFGRFDSKGNLVIDPKELEQLRKELGEEAWRTVRFVACNAPFNRRSPVSQA